MKATKYDLLPKFKEHGYRGFNAGVKKGMIRAYWNESLEAPICVRSVDVFNNNLPRKDMCCTFNLSDYESVADLICAIERFANGGITANRKDGK